MSPASKILHAALIRAAKAAIAAWERWLSDSEREVIPTPHVHPGSPRGPKP